MFETGKVIVTLSLVVITGAIFSGCSSSSDDSTSDKAAAKLVESDFQLKAPFSEKRPKVRIPKKYTCHDENLSPPMSWEGAPDGTVEYALIAEDVDHKTGAWVHWVLYNIPGDVFELTEGISTSTSELPDGTTQGRNDHKNIGYEGPCPKQIVIPGLGYRYMESDPEPAHKYRFSAYALDKNLVLESGVTKSELLEAMAGHILAQADTIGKFQLPVVTTQGQEFKKTSLGVDETKALKRGRSALTPTTTSSQP